MHTGLPADFHLLAEIPHLALLASRIRQAAQRDDVESLQAVEAALELLPYTLSMAAYALLRLARSQRDVVKSVTARTTLQPRTITTILLDQAERDVMAFAIDSFLDASRRAQNASILYLSRVLRTSLPNSLADLAEEPSTARPHVPTRVKDLIINYWRDSGALLKQYRDLCQHHALVSSDGRVTFSPAGEAVVYLVLPNNPGEASPRRLAYKSPRVDAFPYALGAYEGLYAFVFELTHLLMSYTVGPRTQLHGVFFKGRVEAAVEGSPPPAEREVADRLSGLRTELAARLDGELPRSDIAPTLVVPDDSA